MNLVPALLASAAFASAGLEFEQTLLEFHPKPEDQRVVADFSFRNATQRQVKIVNYDAACSCMEVGVARGKLDYAPGEAGVIRAIFRLEGYQGTIDRIIAIWLDGDPRGTPSSQLTLRAHIPQWINIEPKSVDWDLNSPLESRTIAIEMAEGNSRRVVRTHTTNDNFTLELKTLEEAQRYQLIITPKNTASPGIAAFRIDTDHPVEARRSHTVFGVIRMPSR